MVRWIRTAKINGGKFGPAIAWSKEIAGFVTSKHNAPEVKVFIDTFGELGMVRWVADYENLSALEKVNDGVMADQDYWKMIENAMSQNLFVEGSAHDVVMKQV